MWNERVVHELILQRHVNSRSDLNNKSKNIKISPQAKAVDCTEERKVLEKCAQGGLKRVRI
ncbi:Hypothetical protein CINCED_3A007332 [Cinara cedri]|uniref:Uncharacterized protein n=1 Tax=Cinara cedri TaxID=506608 RepID=A0A5E4NB14_9HEMI|nr:Hypothetical protein CINCED_3A007332 [Cinara cedri]